METEANILTINAGSSSIKFAAFDGHANHDVPVLAGSVSGIGTEPRLVVRDRTGLPLADRVWSGGTSLTHEALLDDLLDWLEGHGEVRGLAAVSHRVVHGGTAHATPERVTPALLASLDALCALAPLHQPHNLAAIRAIAAKRPHLPQIACFDTAFHHDMPAVATRFALPRALSEEGVRRFGFHGLSYEYIATRLADADSRFAGGRTVAAHLGNGASLCAMRNGRSVETSMGFSALDGLVMGTRCGALDPGVVLYLMGVKGMDLPAIEHLLYHQSGLLGLSGISSDMRTLQASIDPRASEAIALFVYRIVREAGGMAAALEGLDTLVFTGGIGEKAAAVRSAVCMRLGWLGIELDEEANATDAPLISSCGSRVAVHVIPANEEAMLARHARNLLCQAAP